MLINGQKKAHPPYTKYSILWFFLKFVLWINVMKLHLSIYQKLLFLGASNLLSESHPLIQWSLALKNILFFFFQICMASYCIIVYRTSRVTTEIYSIFQDSLPAHTQILTPIQFPTQREFPFCLSVVFTSTMYLPDSSFRFI